MERELYQHQGNLYKILRRIRHHNLLNLDFVKEMKDFVIGCDHVLKDSTHYLFCITIQDAEITE